MNKGIDTSVEDAYEEHVIIKTPDTLKAFKIGYNSVHNQSVNRAIEIGKHIAIKHLEEHDEWEHVINNKKG